MADSVSALRVVHRFPDPASDQRTGITVLAPELEVSLTYWFLLDDEKGLELVGFEVGGPIPRSQLAQMLNDGVEPPLFTPRTVRHIETHFHRYRRFAEAHWRDDRDAMVAARRPIVNPFATDLAKWERISTTEQARTYLRLVEYWRSIKGGMTEFAIEQGCDRKTVYRREARAKAVLARSASD